LFLQSDGIRDLSQIVFMTFNGSFYNLQLLLKLSTSGPKLFELWLNSG
jgi:hypothetical protein